MTGQSMPSTPATGPARRRALGEFRDVVGQFATGVTVVTVASDGQVRGMTANAFTAVSLDPLLVLVCLRLGCATDELIRTAPSFAVSILSAQQESVAAWFANPDPAGRPPATRRRRLVSRSEHRYAVAGRCARAGWNAPSRNGWWWGTMPSSTAGCWISISAGVVGRWSSIRAASRPSRNSGPSAEFLEQREL